MFEFDSAISSVVRTDVPLTSSADAPAGPLALDLLGRMHRYWQAANYVTIGQIYLQENPLLREPLRPEHIKPRLLGHWGTSPGLSLLYVHLNRLIKAHDINMMLLVGPGHGGPAIVGNVYLEGTYSEVYPDVSQDTRRDCVACSAGSRRQAGFPATSACRRRARFTRAASLDTCSPTRSARPSTIRTSSSPQSSATAKRKPARSPDPGRA
jgi:hypothetical protein